MYQPFPAIHLQNKNYFIIFSFFHLIKTYCISNLGVTEMGTERIRSPATFFGFGAGSGFGLNGMVYIECM